MTDEQQRIILPPSIMAVIKTIASDAGLVPSQRLEGVLLLVFGWAWYERQERVDPRLVALPDAQWQEVCGLLLSGVPSDAINNVNLGLNWMNSGPSGYSD